jgi:hypothetical protein
VTLAGHAIVGAPGCGVGSFGLPHPLNSAASAAAIR